MLRSVGGRNQNKSLNFRSFCSQPGWFHILVGQYHAGETDMKQERRRNIEIRSTVFKFRLSTVNDPTQMPGVCTYRSRLKLQRQRGMRQPSRPKSSFTKLNAVGLSENQIGQPCVCMHRCGEAVVCVL